MAPTPAAPKAPSRRKTGGKKRVADAVWLRIRLSPEAAAMLKEMIDARGGAESARYIVLEEAIRLWHDQDPMLARRKKAKKASDGS